MRVLLFSNLDTEKVFLTSIAQVLSNAGNDVLFYDRWEEYKFKHDHGEFRKRSKNDVPDKKNKISFAIIGIKLLSSLKKLALSRRLLKLTLPDIVILGTDNTYESIYLVKYARKLNIPVVVVPFSMCNHSELEYTAIKIGRYLNIDSRTSQILQYILSIFDFRWIRIEQNKIILVPVHTPIWIQFLLNIMPINPWVICGGKSDFVFVNSQFEKNYYIKSGIDSDKIIIFSNKDVIINSLSTENNNIVWSVPPDHLDNSVYDSHEEMVSWHIDQFNKLDHTVIISPHPRISNDYFEKFQLAPNVSISYQNIHELISKCTYFIASQSATIRFALACNKYIINYRFYNLPYDEYSNLLMVKEVYDKNQFLHDLKKLANGNLFDGTEYDAYENDYFLSQGKNLTEKLFEIKT